MTSALLSLASVFTATFAPLTQAAPLPPSLATIPPPINFNYQNYILSQLYDNTVSVPSAQAQIATNRFYGQVTDKDTASPIAGAAIQVTGTNGNLLGLGVTDQTGYASFRLTNNQF